MNERLVEDWLTKASERSFQTPFAQSLLADGMQVLRVGHGPHEHGKDVIAVDQNGGVHAYQLKQGNLDIRQLEDGFGQIIALVTTQVEHPAIPDCQHHQPWLVISGESSIPVEDRIRVHNKDWKKHGYKQLRTINGKQLLQKFASMAGNFWPQMPEDSRRLFNLYLADGRTSLDRNELAELIANATASASKATKAELGRRLSAANLFGSYALSPFYKSENHWELVQGWTIAAAHIAWVAESAHLPMKLWHPTFRLAVDEALSSLDSLANEALQPSALGPRGFELDELTRSRCTICAGGIAAKMILAVHRGKRWNQEGLAKRTLKRLFSDGRLIVWGESAVPFFLATVWALDISAGDRSSDMVLLNVLSFLVNQNSQFSAAKLPPPYDSVDDANAKGLRRLFENVKALEAQSTASYTLEPLVVLAARRLWRNALARLWCSITKTDLVRLVPDEPRDLLLWHWGYERGSNQTRLFAAPQSWRDLLRESRRDESSSLPDMLRKDFDFAILFLLSFPHRLTTPFVKHLEKQIGAL